jgi:DNA-directed RNA polymerase specialized sigma24 family protein
VEELIEEQSISKVKPPAHYVDNKKFLAALIDYKNSIDVAKANGEEQPRVPHYIGECFIKIATHLSYKSNFINYTFRDDMVSDGIENCLTAAAKFDPTKSSNPFAYYTQIIYFAFIRRIQKEKKQQATKYKLIENMDLDSILMGSEDTESGRQIIDYLKKQLDTIDPERRETPSQTKARKKKKAADDLAEKEADDLAEKDEKNIDFPEEDKYN